MKYILSDRPGFIINVYDPLSLDIDLSLTEEEKGKLPNTLRGSDYIYKDSLESVNVHRSTSFRFRLAGISFRKDFCKGGCKGGCKGAGYLKGYTWSLIHSSDNWVIANVIGIDIFGRFLGTIIIPGLGNLGDHLLNKFPDMFQKYIPK